MLSQSIWWGSIALELLLVVRGSQGKLASRYPVFYSYISFVLVQDILLLVVYRNARINLTVYWTAEFLSVIFGCAVVFEIYRVGLAAYPGAARMSRGVLAFGFTLALAKAIASVWSDPRWWSEASALEIERAVRTVQALAIFVLVALFLFYSISFAKNLRGILLGYGLFIGVRLISLIFVPEQGRNFWYYAYSVAYPVALGIWLAHLWSYSEIRSPEPATARLETDYQRLAAATRRRLQTARGQLAKVVRS